MPKKKQAKTTKSRGIDPTLKPIVVKTKGGSKEEQNDNPLNRKAKLGAVWEDSDSEYDKDKFGVKNIPNLKLPKGFKTADKLTEVDQLQFEMGRLREMLVSWLDRVMIEGVPYQVMIDPLNRQVQINREL